MHLFLYEVFNRDGLPVPEVLCYDDACHLLMYLYNRATRANQFGYSKFAYWLLYQKTVKIVCDRFHFPNHTSEWCKAHVDPAKVTVPGFEWANTQAGEEAFAWLARSKHMFRGMNEARFLFIMLRLAHLRNRQLCM